MNSREAVTLPDPATPAPGGEAWKDARIKVVEDQRAADLELIETLRRAVVARDEKIARMAKHAELKEAHIARRDATIDSLIEKDVRSDADLARHREMDGYLRGEVARLHTENARLRADLAKAGRDLDELTRREAAGTREGIQLPTVPGSTPLPPARYGDAAPPDPGRKVVGFCTGGFADGAGFGPIYEGEPLDLSARGIREAREIPPAPPDPGPFGIDTPEYSDRDREMFVLGVEFAEASRDIRLVTAGDIPACRASSSERTIHDANLLRLMRLADAAGLDYRWSALPDGWFRLHVRRKDS